ncbi:MAG TPA: hypothetical protein DCG57_19395 [Candidatus Riflebacteria bacterium]|jgi:uncharacterized protein YggL (DUF469 family)|nr:hypothetical protein [Candidatus Riflebacteria bacterium]
MKKRLRKKKHVEEFAEWGRQIVIHRNCSEKFDEFLDAFIEEAIEANTCYCGGGGCKDELDAIVELGRRSQGSDNRLQKIVAWLEARTDVESWQIGEEFDLWHGVYKDLNEGI